MFYLYKKTHIFFHFRVLCIFSYLFNFLERDMYNATLESHFESIIYNRAMKPQIY